MNHFLLFESTPDLYISYIDDLGNWSAAKPLNERINRNGKGNPYVPPDQKKLFFVAGSEIDPDNSWSVFWVSTKTIFDF